MRRESLWVIVVPIAIWAAHFVACYMTVAIACAKLGTPFVARLAIAGYTAAALATIAVLVRRRLVVHRQANTQHRFLAFVGAALLGLTALAILYAALAAALVGSCR